MLESDFKEKDMNEVNLQGKKYEDLVKFLCCIYPDRLEHVTGETVYKILPLAIEYQVKVLQQRCHTLLIKIVREKHVTNAKEIYRHIQLAELYTLDQLRDKCIAIASEFTLDKSIEAETAYPVSDKALVQVRNITIKRYEMDRADDEVLFNKITTKSQYAISSGDYFHSMASDNVQKDDYKGTVRNEIKRGSNDVRAVRLCLRYFKDDRELLGQSIKNLKDRLTMPRATIKTKGEKPQGPSQEEEIELLPEMIKSNLFQC
ncbi:uncharacterized protein LOC123557860 isoform X2 [Mercenaria mercenaria]|uniref:uncharacterized protein LOC123557860 isoform X2 n=1 Tax=Mercenaria mercenaria TaxID=6596 RepID=UPI00234F630D|nr:uncharacterized protein LOC123557860 isoform X2 [Mercenaria mercenaria]